MNNGLIIGGANSGCGKTTVALGLMAWFIQQGKRVVPFKVGPDFIDPGHHAGVTGMHSTNLDGWMLRREVNERLFSTHALRGDLALVEGVMGLFDGYDGKSEAGSTAQMAKWLDLPVILVVNAKSMARSAAALVQGFENFDPDLNFAGVIFNNLGSPGHLEYLRDALEDTVRMPCLGGLLRSPELRIPERHLGLYTAEDFALGRDRLGALAEMVDQNLDTQGLLGLAGAPASHRVVAPSRTDPQPAPFGDSGGSAAPGAPGPAVRGNKPTAKIRLAVARDKAFCFYYQENLDLLQQAGAEIVLFSPLRDKHLPPDIQGIYLGGGYPELFAEELASNRAMLAAVRDRSRQGMPIYAECGGFMFLCRTLVLVEGKASQLCNIFPFTCEMLPRLKSLGYREVTLASASIFGPPGERIRGHEFHYSRLTRDAESEAGVYRLSSRKGLDQGVEGFMAGNTLGSYIHLHFASNPRVAGFFVQSCREKQEIYQKLA